jgi:hypothetical protein
MRKQTRKKIVLARKLLLQNNVALASYPRSGNTWLTKLVEALSQKRAGSIHDDPVFPRPAWGILIKTHKLDVFRYNRFVHLTRNPFDAIASYHDYMHAFFPVKAQDWSAHVRTETGKWKAHTAYWLDQKKPHVAIRYEDLTQQPEPELTRLARFLRLDVAETDVKEAIEACTIEKLRERSRREGSDGDNFFRTGAVGRGLARFSPAEIEAVQAELGHWMSHFGYALEGNALRVSGPTATPDSSGGQPWK